MRDGGRLVGFITGIKVGLLFVGTIIGAGFASGKELLTFFNGTDTEVFLSVLLSGVLFYLTGLVFMNLGRAVSSDSLFKISQKLFKKYGSFINYFITFCYLILIAAMLAGVDSLAVSAGYEGFPVFSLIVLIIALVIVRHGLKGLIHITSLLVPAVILFLLIICGLTLSENFVLHSGISSVSRFGFAYSAFNCLLYVAFNMLLSAAVLTSAGKGLNSKQINTASVIAAIIITAIMGMLLISCRLFYPQIQGMDMPTIFLAEKVSGLAANIAVLIIGTAIFITLISSLYPLNNYLSGFVENKFLRDIGVGLTAYLLSRMGFSYIVEYIYPLQGVIGIVFIIMCVHHLFSLRKERNKPPDK